MLPLASILKASLYCSAVVPGSQFFSVDTNHLEPDSGVRLAGPGEMPAEHGARDRWLRESIEPLGGDGFGTADEDLRVVVPPGAVLITHCEHRSLPDGSLLLSTWDSLVKADRCCVQTTSFTGLRDTAAATLRGDRW